MLRAAEAGPRAAADSDSSDTEPDEGALPVGSGVRGVGPPLTVGRGPKQRDLCDGAGICSVGRWAPRQRPSSTQPRLLTARAATKRFIARLDGRLGGNGLRDLFGKLCRGEVMDNPFPMEEILSLRGHLEALFDDAPLQARPRDSDRPQPVRIRLLQAILHDGGDPDWQGIDHYGSGIRLGVGTRLPRTPAVFRRKRRWRLEGQDDPEGWRTASVASVWRDNYTSARDQLGEIERQLAECHDAGWAIRLSPEEAVAKFPGLIISSLGAVVKRDAGGQVQSVRMVLDGTHGVRINNSIRVRDQDRCPTAADLRRVQRAQGDYSAGLGLAADVKSAHRLPPVAPEDWHLQGCRARPGGDIFIFTVGVFGVSSIAYWWARLGGAAIRALHLLADVDDELWLLLMADDVLIQSTCPYPERPVLWVLLLLSVLGFPLSWRKTQGGERAEWIGYDVWIKELRLGITSSRAAWATGWLRRISRDRTVAIDDFRSGLGRLSFIAGVLEYERPFLAPCFSFVSLHRPRAVRPVPLYISCILEHLAERIELRRTYPSVCEWTDGEFSPRVDARAEGSDVAIGGWLPRRGADGSICRAASPWFAITLNRHNAPWAFSKSGEAYRTIAALEAMATLVAVILFAPMVPRRSRGQVMLTSVTDNKGNMYALSRLMSTKFPLCLIVMELAAQLERHEMRLNVEWTPRDLNQEADDLSNFRFAGFHPAHRLGSRLEDINFIVLDRLLCHALEFEEARREARAGARR